jgi:hypothetical protein
MYSIRALDPTLDPTLDQAQRVAADRGLPCLARQR